MLFAMSSWIDICGIWVEIPLLVTSLPEGWALPSFFVIIIQIANVGPIMFSLLRRLRVLQGKEWLAVYVILLVGSTSCFILIFSWDVTSTFNGSLHSVGLLTMCAVLALVDCTSSVVYLPYMVIFQPHYITALYVGEGLSGLVPGILGLLQGLNVDPICRNETTTWLNLTSNMTITNIALVPYYSKPLFSVEIFFLLLFFLLCISITAFSLLHFHPRCKEAYVQKQTDKSFNGVDMLYLKENSELNVSVQEKNVMLAEDDIKGNNINNTHHNKYRGQQTSVITQTNILSKPSYIWYLIVIVWVNAQMNGFLPSIQSFASLPYGNLAYTLTVRLSTVANPLACFAAFFIPTASLVVITVMVTIGSGISMFIFVLATFSPHPPLQGSVMGVITVVS